MVDEQKPEKRDQTQVAPPEEPRIEFPIGGLAAATLQIDSRGIWRNLEVLSSRRMGRSGWLYKVRLPTADAKAMLGDCLDRGSQSMGGEGYDQEVGSKYACRKLAELLSNMLGEPKPIWWR